MTHRHTLDCEHTSLYIHERGGAVFANFVFVIFTGAGGFTTVHTQLVAVRGLTSVRPLSPRTFWLVCGMVPLSRCWIYFQQCCRVCCAAPCLKALHASVKDSFLVAGFFVPRCCLRQQRWRHFCKTFGCASGMSQRKRMCGLAVAGGIKIFSLK